MVTETVHEGNKFRDVYNIKDAKRNIVQLTRNKIKKKYIKFRKIQFLTAPCLLQRN